MTTITIDRAVVEQVLEALEHHGGNLPWNAFVEVRKDLRAALAQQAEPLNLRDPAVQKRLATQWGYVPAAQAEPVEPVAWKQGSLVTFNEDPYPALGGLFVQLWDGEEVAARVYANDLKTLRQRCAKVNTAPPQRKPLTEEEIVDAVREAEMESRKLERFAALVAAAEREACAALLEANGMRCGEESLSRLILETNAAAIRARNNT